MRLGIIIAYCSEIDWLLEEEEKILKTYQTMNYALLTYVILINLGTIQKDCALQIESILLLCIVYCLNTCYIYKVLYMCTCGVIYAHLVDHGLLED